MGTLFRSAVMNELISKHPMDGVRYTKPVRAVDDIKFLLCDKDVPAHCRFQAGMTKELLQGLGLHPAFDGPGGIGVAKSVHTEPPDSSFITELVQMGIIGAVLVRKKVAQLLSVCLFVGDGVADG